MSRTKFVFLALAFAWCATSYASPTGRSIGINFGADEPNFLEEGYVNGAAGVAGTVNWNNTIELTGILDDVQMDVNGTTAGTSVEVEWISNNTWASDGRGENNNNAPPGNDRALMLGYLDTTDTSITEVVVSNLPAEIAAGFDVFVYTLGGVLDRGGTFTIGDQSQDNLQTTIFDGAYIQGSEGNYLLFEGLSGDGFTLEAMATTPALFRAALNAIEICAAGECIPLPTPVAGRGNIGDQAVTTTRENAVFAPGGDPMPGLAQEWFAAANPGNKGAADAVFSGTAPMVEPFRAGHGTTWWSGNQAPFGELVQYPDEVQPPLNGTDNDNYSTRLTGEILIPESGTYRFTDGVDDFTWLAIDADKSGIAGDVPEEVLIDDNAWTSVFRDQNNGGVGLGEVDLNVAAGGEWLAIEFNQGEGGGSDAGVVYWDYDPNAPEGQRLGGQEGFPEVPEDPIDPGDAETMYIPDTHLRSSIQTLLSADLVGSLAGAPTGFEFEINGDDDTADRLVLNNPDEAVYTTILDVDGVTFQISPMGSVQQGDSFQIVDANQINGVPVVVSTDGQTWTFNPLTGFITLGGGQRGDFNNDGVLDASDIDELTRQSAAGDNNLAYDLTGDGRVDVSDVSEWIKADDIFKSWIGDANLDKEFNSSDLVAVLSSGTYEADVDAVWSTGDFNGDGRANTSDLVAALTDGGYEIGPRMAVAAVPEPSTVILLAIGLLGLCRFRR